MSTNLKDRLIRIDDIPSGSERLLEQGNKPYFPLIVLLICSIILLILPQARFIGLALTVILVYVLIGAKERKLFTITTNYIIIYLYHNDLECNIFYLEEIVSWEFKAGKTTLDMIELKLNDGSAYSFETTNPNKLLKVMRSIMASREIKLDKKR